MAAGELTLTQPNTTIHWGGVVKGVAIVTAVAVVGVAAFYGAGWLLATPQIAPIVSSVAHLVAPAATAISGGLQAMAGGLSAAVQGAPAVISGFFNGIAQGLGFAAPSAVAVAQTSHGMAAAVAGGAVAVSVPVAASALQQTDWVAHSASTHDAAMLGAQHAAGHGNFLSDITQHLDQLNPLHSQHLMAADPAAGHADHALTHAATEQLNHHATEHLLTQKSGVAGADALDMPDTEVAAAADHQPKSWTARVKSAHPSHESGDHRRPAPQSFAARAPQPGQSHLQGLESERSEAAGTAVQPGV